MIQELTVDFDIKECCEALRVSRSGSYRGHNAEPSRREKENAELVEQIKDVFEANKSRYGSPRIAKELRPQGRKCGQEPHSSLDAGKRTGSSWQEGVWGPVRRYRAAALRLIG
jgi:transposase InsO family protein